MMAFVFTASNALKNTSKASWKSLVKPCRRRTTSRDFLICYFRIGSLRSLRRGLAFLTTFAVATRYPGDDANRRQAKASIRWAEKVRIQARRLLGLRTSRPD